MAHKRKRAEQDTSGTAPAPKKHQKKREKTSAKPVALPSLEISPFVDNPKGEELKREVQLYDLLASEDERERLGAAKAIVSGLLEGNGVEESTLQRHLERRLFRGLASGRKGARLGYSVVLAEILGQLFGEKDLSSNKYTGLTFDKILDFLIAKTKPEGDLSGQELKDHFLGLLFGLQSFVRAKVLYGDGDRWNAIFEKLLDLSKKKPWIREECGWVVVEALAQMNQSQAEGTLEKLQEAGLALSPEGVGIWLQAKNRFPDMKCPSKPWGQNGNPLAHLKSLAKALKESSKNDENEKSEKSQKVNQTGNWNPKLHFVWNLVLAQYAASMQDNSPDIKSDFENFWKVAVDENLFSATASRERKFWGFLLFQKVLQEAETYSAFFSSIFSHNLMRCLINHIQDADRFLNRSADKSLKILIQAIESNPTLLPMILPHLIGEYGNYNFDKVTKTKTVERLLVMVNNDNASAIIEALTELTISFPGTDADAIREVEIRRLTFGDYLLNMIRKTNAIEAGDTHWIEAYALPTLAKFAYSKYKECQPPLSDKSRTIFHNRLQSAFTHLLTDLSAYKYPCGLLKTFSPDDVKMDDGISNAKDRAMSTMDKILKKAKKAQENEKSPLQGLGLLYSLVIFQLYNGESEAITILDELKLCYDKLIRHKDSENSDIDASEVLVELLLSFISKPSALLRKVSQLVFGAFMSEISAGGLKLMTDVLESGESLRGQQELFEQEPEDGDGVEIDDSDELDSDVEVIDMNGDEGTFNGHLDEENDESENASEEEGESDGPEDEEAKKLDDALAKALGTHRLDEDAAAESDNDADMTDSEMMALDSKLVEIFKQRKKVPNKKQEQKDAKETMVNFKTRVLDLLDIFAKKQASNPLAFDLLLPLLQLMRTTKTKQLAEKAHGIIIAFAKAAKKTEGEVVVSEQIKLLKAIHLEASKDPSHSFSKAASTASLLVASNLYRSNKSTVKKIAGVYRDSQVAWVEGEVKMQAAFFMEWVNWCQSHANA